MWFVIESLLIGRYVFILWIGKERFLFLIFRITALNNMICWDVVKILLIIPRRRVEQLLFAIDIVLRLTFVLISFYKIFYSMRGRIILRVDCINGFVNFFLWSFGSENMNLYVKGALNLLEFLQFRLLVAFWRTLSLDAGSGAEKRQRCFMLIFVIIW